MPRSESEPRVEELSDNDKLKWCLENLGPGITTVALNPGGLDVRTVSGWAHGEIAEPALPRLTMLYGAAKRVSEIYDERTARAFLRSSNPIVGDSSLLLMIADMEPELAAPIVETAVSAFIE